MAKQPTKFRKPRKPMSEEQRKAAGERLALAREKRMKENPPQYKSIHPDVVALSDEHPLSMKKVREWIKVNREEIPTLRKNARMDVKGAKAALGRKEGYVNNMERYLRDGIWVDMFYGEQQQNKIKYKSVAMAYHRDGTPKRMDGVFYPDLGYEWNSLTCVEPGAE